MTNAVPRDEFVQMIEQGIRAASITDAPAAKLRKVAATAKRIGTGSFAVRSGAQGRALCHCPLSAAHLADDEGNPRPRSGLSRTQVGQFATVFDDAVNRYVLDHRTTAIHDADEGSFFHVAV